MCVSPPLPCPSPCSERGGCGAWSVQPVVQQQLDTQLLVGRVWQPGGHKQQREQRQQLRSASSSLAVVVGDASAASRDWHCCGCSGLGLGLLALLVVVQQPGRATLCVRELVILEPPGPCLSRCTLLCCPVKDTSIGRKKATTISPTDSPITFILTQSLNKRTASDMGSDVPPHAASLAEIAAFMAAPGKGILASDESTGTIGKRLEKVGLQNDEVGCWSLFLLLQVDPACLGCRQYQDRHNPGTSHPYTCPCAVLGSA